jgi:hypothetical protein
MREEISAFVTTLRAKAYPSIFGVKNKAAIAAEIAVVCRVVGRRAWGGW